MTYTHYAAFVLALAVASWLVHALLIEIRVRRLRNAWRKALEGATGREFSR